MVIVMAAGRGRDGGREECLEREGGDAVLKAFSTGRDGGAEEPRGQDRQQQQPRGGFRVGADVAVGLAEPDQVREVIGDRAPRAWPAR